MDWLFPKLPRLGTLASKNYYRSWLRINSFYSWVLFMTGAIDEMRKTARDALLATEDEEKRKKYEEEIVEGTTMVDVLKDNRQFFLEIILVRHVENYLNYLSSLLFEIFTQRPETLKSSEKVEISTVLNHDSIDDLVQHVAERKIETLSYSSFESLTGFFFDRFNLELFEAGNMATMVEAIEVRNISVHNRCIINRRYLSRVGGSPDLLGKRKELYLRDLQTIIPLIYEGVKKLDKNARSKLKLKGVRYQIRLGQE